MFVCFFILFFWGEGKTHILILIDLCNPVWNAKAGQAVTKTNLFDIYKPVFNFTNAIVQHNFVQLYVNNT